MRKTILTLTAVLALTVGNAFVGQNAELDVNVPTKTILETAEISTFCKAVISGDLETVQKMIELGEDVNQKSLGMRPVHFAARYNKVEILELLVANGADLSVKCDKGYTAEKYAKLSHADAALTYIETVMKS